MNDSSWLLCAGLWPTMSSIHAIESDESCILYAKKSSSLDSEKLCVAKDGGQGEN